jgi:carotenoid cleavage dioxygenase
MTFEDLADHPAFQSNLAPVMEEGVDLPATLIAGSLPQEISGTLLRIGPNPRFPPPNPAEHHWFLGDGMVHALRLEAGRCTYSNRWVRTRKWREEDRARRSLFGGWGYRPVEGVPAIALDGTANTNLALQGGRLWALQESSPPIEMVATDLSTVGQQTFGGQLTQAFTAHPKLDAATGELVAHGVQTAGFASTQAYYYVIDDGGELVRAEAFELPFAGYVHDFLITSRYVIFPLSPLVADRLSARRGQPYVWHGDRPALVGVFDRFQGPAAIQWLETSAFYVFHVFNAYDEADGRIVADVLEYSRPPLFPDASGRVPSNAEISSSVTRWIIKVGPDPSIAREQVCPSPAHSLEFPMIDERRSALRHDVGYFVGRQDGERIGFNTLARVNFNSGEVQSKRFGADDMLSEPIFVPRNRDAAPDDGWLAFLLYRADRGTSELHLQDARTLSAAPQAIFALPRRVPQGFHGLWMPHE